VTATIAISAAGLLGAPSKAELLEKPYLEDEPSLKTQILFNGVEVKAKGKNRGDPLYGACPTDLLPDYAQFCVAQTPTHFARFSSTKLLFKDVLVPYYEAMIAKLGLVGKKKIDELKSDGSYDKSDPAHEHQHVVLQWDVYSVHREKRTREWIKKEHPWILLLFVPASTTPKLQELDVGCNSQIQSGARIALNNLQIVLYAALRERDPDVLVPVLDRPNAELKRDVFPLLEAGLEAGRKVGVANLKKLWETTGKSGAWESDYQLKARDLHARGKLFCGERKEDTPHGQEGEPLELEANDAPLPAGAPPMPKYKKTSPQQIYIAATRDNLKATRSLSTLKEAENIAKQKWKKLKPGERKAWTGEKTKRLEAYRKSLKEWREIIKRLLAAAARLAGEEVNEENKEEDDDEDAEEEEEGGAEEEEEDDDDEDAEEEEEGGAEEEEEDDEDEDEDDAAPRVARSDEDDDDEEDEEEDVTMSRMEPAKLSKRRAASLDLDADDDDDDADDDDNDDDFAVIMALNNKKKKKIK
jgi:hypothetical protein